MAERQRLAEAEDVLRAADVAEVCAQHHQQRPVLLAQLLVARQRRHYHVGRDLAPVAALRRVHRRPRSVNADQLEILYRVIQVN